MRKLVGKVLIVFFSLLTVADLLLTWINTPDLAREANPLVTRLGLGWPALILSNILVLSLYIFFVYYAFFHYPDRKYASRTGSAMPASSTIALLGYTFAFSMLFGRLIPVTEWLLVTLDKPMDWFYKLFQRVPTNRPDIVISGVLALVFAVQWLLWESYEERRYRKTMGEGNTWVN